jgi:phthiocerol/phenolphthiocerol synthesis type-I polyketide synthase D
MQQSTNPQIIERWLQTYLAECLEVDASTVDLDTEFVDMGLSSRDAVAMTGDLEDLTGQIVDPAVAFDYPTVRRLSEYLGGRHAASVHAA